jgi:tRNA (adenine37-N6)-methyltransferase
MNKVERFIVRAIGRVENGVQDIGFNDWKTLSSRLVIEETYVEALDGIEEFSHLFVICRLHLPGKVLLKRHPRDRQDLPVVGIFATRSQLRPNGLGLHLVRLVERRGNELLVKGMDAISGTPIIDIKPYLPQRDVAANAAVPEWTKKLDDTQESVAKRIK